MKSQAIRDLMFDLVAKGRSKIEIADILGGEEKHDLSLVASGERTSAQAGSTIWKEEYE